MAYIGKQAVVGNFQKCDAISVVNGQAAYTLNVGGAAVTPENANHMLVSLNGVLQAPGDSFTISGSTLTFASNLATGDVIDFVIILGDVLALGTPSDNSISTAKLVANSVTAAKFNADVISGQTALAETPADTDELLLSDAGVLKRVDFSHLKGGGMWEFISSTNVTSGVSEVDFTTLSTDFIDFCIVITDIHPATDSVKLYSRVFTGTSGSQAIVTSSSYHFANVVHDNQVDQDNGTGQDKIELSRPMGSDDNEASSLEVVLFNPHSTTFHTIMKCHAVLQQQDTGRTGILNSAGKYAATTAVTGIRFYFSSGNIDNGRFSLYGRKHS